ncbi:conserved hypothetical protein [Coccidioides posadasii str. Silveira]|uniref:Uncharacterized protein n=1 Tax=Coccidioides posadasii (strain RMSCC 757 / Silveira) TaxID=443226 RepID=E9DCJ1_COCPS|nr:conserved hypothetical protein [Coccidioides posadasii str. Silveira]
MDHSVLGHEKQSWQTLATLGVQELGYLYEKQRVDLRSRGRGHGAVFRLCPSHYAIAVFLWAPWNIQSSADKADLFELLGEMVDIEIFEQFSRHIGMEKHMLCCRKKSLNEKQSCQS